MDYSGSNALNRSMQGLWSAHRRTKINLNSLPSPNTSPAPTPPTAETEASVPMPLAPLPSSTILNPPVPAPTTDTDTPTAIPETQTGKRKVRSTKSTEGSSSKRTKISSASTSANGSIAKDHAPPTARLSDLGGVEACIEKMLELVAMPLCHPEVYLHTGVQPPRGVLLHGPPGCGKTLLANAMAGELGVPFISISAPSIVSGMSGESEKTLRDMFEGAKRVAPCLLFINEADAITPKRESARRERDALSHNMSWEKNDNKPVIVIGAKNRPDSLDAALHRAGRFGHETSMGVPDDEARANADLAALTGAADIITVKRIFKQLSDGTFILPDDFPLSPLCITSSSYLFKHVQPSLEREGFATVPDVTWSDVCALHGVRFGAAYGYRSAYQAAPEVFMKVGISVACGVLLWGPPGCGKTLLAKAVANESRVNFISVKGPELLNKYVGESERTVRTSLFARPCFIATHSFLGAMVNLSESSARVVSTLPAQLDSFDCHKGIYVVVATGRPDIIDPAMTRSKIVSTVLKRLPLGELGVRNVMGIVACVREAGAAALRRTLGALDKMDRESSVGGGVRIGGQEGEREGEGEIGHNTSWEADPPKLQLGPSRRKNMNSMSHTPGDVAVPPWIAPGG
ncbi:AAA-domain-containing protein [Macrolepiota fuliginosa MF-IS2]|uniref:AAA-domain-containing protein n=1 Tax=Macrolepiota fuliginosa MF-IS2 TaxID=1400762 RepID=A0A9P6C5W1_9AGAR|nr:AAA-domain-containing protein [Macrolepiota fuliginosa MF-IS2]